MNGQKFAELSKSFFVDSNFVQAFRQIGLTSIDAVFSFDTGKNLTKDNLSPHRTRLQFQVDSPPAVLFLKRYDSPPPLTQARNWLSRRKKQSCALAELEVTMQLQQAGINTPRIIAYGEQWGSVFEKRSFTISEKIPNAESIERKLPQCFYQPSAPENLRLLRNFIVQLAEFIREFHKTGFRHRDLYFSHIFYSDSGKFYLIDLARAFRPKMLTHKYHLKDIAQIHYSAPRRYFSNTDRLRFYLAYTSKHRLTPEHKTFIRKVIIKARRMAAHDTKHGRVPPFEIIGD